VALLALLIHQLVETLLLLIIIMLFGPQQGEFMLRCILEATDGLAGLG
jgi:hypothetical protein